MFLAASRGVSAPGIRCSSEAFSFCEGVLFRLWRRLGFGYARCVVGSAAHVAGRRYV